MLVGRPSVVVTEVAANHFIRIEEGMGPLKSPAANRRRGCNRGREAE
jgi:hypothetical protein